MPCLTRLRMRYQDEEGGVAFIDMPHRRRQSEFVEGADPADAEEDFLLETRGAVAPP